MARGNIGLYASGSSYGGSMELGPQNHEGLGLKVYKALMDFPIQCSFFLGSLTNVTAKT